MMGDLDMEASSMWLAKTTMAPWKEAKLCQLQDRNIHWITKDTPHKRCGSSLTVEHLATRCDKMKELEYTFRHDEVAKRIHYALAKQIGIKRMKKIGHRVRDIQFANDGLYITFNKTIHTENATDCNRPDIVVGAKRRNVITVVEVGITSHTNLKETEKQKKIKYMELVKNMAAKKFNEHTEIHVVPHVMTWDGWVTKYHKQYRHRLGITERVEGQIQRVCLQRTYEIVKRELGENFETGDGGDPYRKRREGLYALLESLPDDRSSP